MTKHLPQYIILCIAVFVSSCGSKKVLEPVFPTGYFEPYNYLDTIDNFATALPVVPNKLKKITDGLSSYYSWKTIKTDIRIDTINNEYFSAYKTITNSDFEEMNMEGKKYLRTEKKVLNNYLFFLDDCRVIYLSEDDGRFDLNYGLLNLMFLETYDCIEPNDQKIYSQATRGYYAINGNKIEFDFKGKKEFYIEGIIDEDFNKITFEKISIDSEKIDNDLGLKNRYESFQNVFSDLAQPIFEVPERNSIVKENSFQLTFGVINCEVSNKKLRKFRKTLIDQGNITQPQMFSGIIDSIYYEINEDTYTYLRHYKYKILDSSNFTESEPLIYSEDLSNMVTW